MLSHRQQVDTIQRATLDTAITLAIQCDLVNKPRPLTPRHKRLHAHGWQTTQLTIAELRKHITVSGFAFCTAALTSDNRRKENFSSAWGILIDLDENSLLDGQNDPILGRVATFGFTTPSHTPENPRAKFGCVFDRPVTDAGLFARYTEALMKRITTVTVDTSGKDAARFSYGSQGGQWAFYGNVLSVDWLNEIVAQDAIEDTTQHSPIVKPDFTVSETRPALIETVISRLKSLGYTDAPNGWLNGSCIYGENHTHNDREHSAGIDPVTGVYHCFVCGSHAPEVIAERLNIAKPQKPITDNETKSGMYSTLRNELNQRKLTAIATVLEPFYMNGNEGHILIDIDSFIEACGRYGQYLNYKKVYRAFRQTITASKMIDGVLIFDSSETATQRQYSLFQDDDLSSEDSSEHVFSIFFPLLDTTLLGAKVENTTKQFKKPKKQYYIPSQRELAFLFGITPIDRRPFLVSALASNKAYREQSLFVAVENLADKNEDGTIRDMSNKQYGQIIGVHRKTASRYLREHKNIDVEPQEPHRVGFILRENPVLPEYLNGRYHHLMVDGIDTLYPCSPEQLKRLFDSPRNYSKVYIYAPSCNAISIVSDNVLALRDIMTKGQAA